MVELYCGNNAADPDLVNGKKIMGTRYGCMKRGIGVGLHLPYNPNYLGDYDPIDDTKVYCGNKPDLPVDYDRFGNLPQCQSKGVGIGMKLRAEKGPPPGYTIKKASMYILPLFIFLALSTGLFLGLYFGKPSFVIKEIDNKTEIDWGKFMMYYTTSTLIIGIIIFLIWKFYVFRR